MIPKRSVKSSIVTLYLNKCWSVNTLVKAMNNWKTFYLYPFVNNWKEWVFILSVPFPWTLLWCCKQKKESGLLSIIIITSRADVIEFARCLLHSESLPFCAANSITVRQGRAGHRRILRAPARTFPAADVFLQFSRVPQWLGELSKKTHRALSIKLEWKCKMFKMYCLQFHILLYFSYKISRVY